MPTRYPTDRFDDLPDELTRVGAHRSPARPGRGWIAFAWAALATGVLVGAGVIALTAFSDSLNLPFAGSIADGSAEPAPSETVPETAAPLLDPAVSVRVVNGTTTNGLANAVGDELVANGWCGATGPEGPAEGPCVGRAGLGTRLTASEPVATTVVYYNAPERESAARAVVESLGAGDVALSDVYPDSPITVVLGADYPVPVG